MPNPADHDSYSQHMRHPVIQMYVVVSHIHIVIRMMWPLLFPLHMVDRDINNTTIPPQILSGVDVSTPNGRVQVRTNEIIVYMASAQSHMIIHQYRRDWPWPTQKKLDQR